MNKANYYINLKKVYPHKTSNYDAIYLKLLQCYMSIISPLKTKKRYTPKMLPSYFFSNRIVGSFYPLLHTSKLSD